MIAIVVLAWEFGVEPLAMHNWQHKANYSQWHFALFGVGAAVFALIPPLIWLSRSNRARTRAEQELKDVCDNLELTVSERTAAYERVNVELKNEMKRHATSAALLRDVTENIREVFWASTADGDKMLYVSPAYEEIWGRSVHTLYTEPMSFLQAIHPQDRENGILPIDRTVNVDETYRIIKSDGTIRWIRDRSYPVKDEHGAITRVVGIAEDITELKRLQENLTRSQRLEAVGTLAGGIAHDFNNLLATISVSTGTLKVESDAKGRESAIDNISYACKEGKGLVKNLLRFARKEQTIRQVMSPAMLISETIQVIRSTFDRRIDIQSDVAPSLNNIFGDPSQIHQLLMNLVVNARDAILTNGKGVLSITAKNVFLSAGSPLLPTNGKPGDYVEITVSDDGCGIPRDAQKHVFDPFFSTKEPGQGIGLGLATVHGIVTDHGGGIGFESVEGEGTRFCVILPATTTEIEKPAIQPTASPGIVTTDVAGTILVVDDEERLCQSVAHFLESAGHTVLTAKDGNEALDKIDRAGNKLDLIILDLMMPQVAGWDVLRQIHQNHTELSVIIMSGYADTDRYREIEALGFDGQLDKPFELHELEAEVSRVLALRMKA